MKSTKTAATEPFKINLFSEKKSKLYFDLQEAAVTVLKEEKIRKYELNIVITWDRRIKEINLEFRGKNKPTDVITFPGKTAAEIYISSDTAVKQAKEAGVTLKTELTRLLVHGVLHAIGYDHEKGKAAERKMFDRQEKYLKIIGTKKKKRRK